MTARLLLTAILFGAAPAFAQDGKPLAVGDGVPSSYRAFVVADERFEKGSVRNRANKMHCLVLENALNPVVAVFSRTAPAADGPAAKLAAALNPLVTKDYKPDRFGAFIIFLTLEKEYPLDDQRDAKAKAVADLAAQTKTPGVPFALAAGKSPTTAAWGLDEKDELVVLFYHKMIVTKKWAFTAEKAPTDDDVKAVTAAVAAELKAKK